LSKLVFTLRCLETPAKAGRTDLLEFADLLE